MPVPRQRLSTKSHAEHALCAAGSHHFVCCVDIQTSDNPHSPHGNMNPLDDVIKAASDESSFSWCTCSEEVTGHPPILVPPSLQPPMAYRRPC